MFRLLLILSLALGAVFAASILAVDPTPIVSLQFVSLPYCTGFLISNTWVVTTAHCLSGRKTLMNVRVGSSTIDDGGETIYVQNVIIHPKWDPKINYDADIALLELDQLVTISTATAISLAPAGSTIAAGTPVTINGFADLEDGDVASVIIQERTVPAITNSVCRRAYGGGSNVTSHMMCAGNLGPAKRGKCRGLQGAVATVRGVAVGLVSWSLGCARSGQPVVFTRIASYRRWIKEITGV